MNLPPFRNEPMTDWTNPENVRRMEAALDKVRSEFGRTYPLIIGGKEIHLEDTIASINPAKPDQVVGRFAKATADHALQAIAAADEAFKHWSRVPGDERARCLLKTAAVLRERKFELAAWMVYEVSKSWTEAEDRKSTRLNSSH